VYTLDVFSLFVIAPIIEDIHPSIMTGYSLRSRKVMSPGEIQELMDKVNKDLGVDLHLTPEDTTAGTVEEPTVGGAQDTPPPGDAVASDGNTTDEVPEDPDTNERPKKGKASVHTPWHVPSEFQTPADDARIQYDLGTSQKPRSAVLGQHFGFAGGVLQKTGPMFPRGDTLPSNLQFLLLAVHTTQAVFSLSRSAPRRTGSRDPARLFDGPQLKTRCKYLRYKSY